MPLRLALSLALVLPPAATQDDGIILSSAHRIGDDAEVFEKPLADGNAFGSSLAALGDLDGDGIGDVAVGAPGDDAGGLSRGAIHLLFLAPDGTAKLARRIDATTDAFAGGIEDLDAFGTAVVSPGDVDGDGTPDLAVGAPLDDDGGTGPVENRGAVWILYLARGGGVRDVAKISALAGEFPARIQPGSWFGSALAAPGDFDGDGVPDLVVGAPGDEGGEAKGGAGGGAVWLLLLQADGSVKSAQRMAQGMIGTGPTKNRKGERFGSALAFLGGPDSRGFRRLAVGAPRAHANGRRGGAVWILRLDAEGQVRARTAIGPRAGFDTPLAAGDGFGCALAFAGDLAGDGGLHLAIGARGDDGGRQRSDRGAVWLVELDAYDRVRSHQRLTVDQAGTDPPALDPFDGFGTSLAAPGDLDGNGRPDLVVGADGDATDGVRRGAVWVLRFTDCRPAGTRTRTGRGITGERLTCSTPPRMGSTWAVELDCTGHEPLECALIISKTPAKFRHPKLGMFLVSVLAKETVYLGRAPHRGDVVSFPFEVPDEPAFCGVRLYLQGVVLGKPGREMTNALDAQIGR